MIVQMQDDQIEIIRKIIESGDVRQRVKQYFEKYNVKMI